MKTLRIPRLVALGAIAFLVTAGILVSFMESYRALYWWAERHAVQGMWGSIWPIQIDAFVAVGELALFVAMTDVWQVKHRSLPWIITGCGLAVSVAGNIGHVVTTDIFTRLTAAVAPLSAYVMLAAGLGLLKRVIANRPMEKPKRASGRRKEKPSDSIPPTHVEPEPTAATTNQMWPESWTKHDHTGSQPRVGKDGLPVA